MGSKFPAAPSNLLHMKTVSLKLIGLVAFIAAAIAILAHGQQSTSKSHPVLITTNRVGLAVAAKDDPYDRNIAIKGPSPTVLHDVQLGLRSDGVVVWRRSK